MTPSQEHERTLGMNAAKADPDQNMSYSASVYSFSWQHCFYFNFLGGSPHRPSHAFQTDAIQFKEVKASQSNSNNSFKLSLSASVKMSPTVM
jgi:hypothetical protein